MASPRFIGIRDVVNPYRGLQDSVSKVGDIYRQYSKDVQEADRIRNEEARQNERLAMDRATHKQQQDKYAEEQRRNEVIRGFDPEKQIENYGIPERFIPEISKRDEQVRDYYSRAPLIAAGSGEAGTQARQQVEESLGTARTVARAEAFDATTAQRQGLDYLISQGVPASEAVAIVQARTLGQLSHTDKHAAIVAQAKAEDDHAMELAKIWKDIARSQISANKGSTSGSTTSGKTGSSTDIIKENFNDVGIKLKDQENAVKSFKTIIGDGFNSEGFFGWTGNATNAVNSIVASVTELNNETADHNKSVILGKTKGELRKYIDFNDAVKWVGGTAKKGSNIKLTNPGELKVFIEDTAKRRDFSEAANKARELEAKKKAGELDGEKKAGGFLTGDDIKASMPQRIAVPPVNQVVLASITSSYANMFPEVFPKPPSATTPIPRPSNATADEEVDSKTDTKSTADGKPNIIGGTLNNVQASEQPKQPISREVLLPYSTESPTSAQVNINSGVARLAEIQTILADPSLSKTEKKEHYQEAKIIRDSLTQLPERDRIFETIRGNADQAKEQAAKEKAQAQEEQKSRESIINESLKIRERLAADDLSPTAERINKDRLQYLEQSFPLPKDSTSPEFENYISDLETRINHRSAPGRGWLSSITLPKLQQELDEAKRLAGYQKTDGDRLTPSNELSTREYIQKTFGPTSDPFIDSIMNLSNPPDTEDISTPIIDDKVTLPSPVHPDVPVMKSNKVLQAYKTVSFGTNEGDPIKTVKGGRVRYVGPIRNRGQSIIIEHDDGTVATYSDWSEDVRVKKDERIKAGDVLMIASGVRDRTMFSVYNKNRKPEDPLEWLKKNTTNT